jgi:CRISPR/Cas system CSM-associated protein Csm2 small subunit
MVFGWIQKYILRPLFLLKYGRKIDDKMQEVLTERIEQLKKNLIKMRHTAKENEERRQEIVNMTMKMLEKDIDKLKTSNNARLDAWKDFQEIMQSKELKGADLNVEKILKYFTEKGFYDPKTGQFNVDRLSPKISLDPTHAESIQKLTKQLNELTGSLKETENLLAKFGGSKLFDEIEKRVEDDILKDNPKLRSFIQQQRQRQQQQQQSSSQERK